MEITIKQVKKANQWCVTYFEGTVQKQEWLGTKEEAVKFKSSIIDQYD